MQDYTDDDVEAAIATSALTEAMHIRLDDAALAQAKLMAADPERVGMALRFYIDGKGCDGFFYGVAFDQPTARDIAYEQNGLRLIVDPESLRFMHASLVEWVDDERGRGFLVSNPNHKRYRGKFYKKSAWKDKLVAPTPSAPHL